MPDIEVAYALAQRQSIIELTVEPGCTARQAALQSNLDQVFDQLDLATNPLGIFGVEVADDQVLKDGDRVELYRPLVIDPMEQRRQRAAAAKKAAANKRR